MRRVLYHGKSLATGEWVEGSLLVDERGRHYIGTYIAANERGNLYVVGARGCGKTVNRFCGIGFVQVDSSTVGQYSGIEDLNKHPIFEGDIVCRPNGDVGVVVWNLTGFYFRYESPFAHGFHCDLIPLCNFLNAHGPIIEKIGNVHDNPELMGGDGDALD